MLLSSLPSRGSLPSWPATADNAASDHSERISSSGVRASSRGLGGSVSGSGSGWAGRARNWSRGWRGLGGSGRMGFISSNQEGPSFSSMAYHGRGVQRVLGS